MKPYNAPAIRVNAIIPIEQAQHAAHAVSLLAEMAGEVAKRERLLTR